MVKKKSPSFREYGYLGKNIKPCHAYTNPYKKREFISITDSTKILKLPSQT